MPILLFLPLNEEKFRTQNDICKCSRISKIKKKKIIHKYSLSLLSISARCDQLDNPGTAQQLKIQQLNAMSKHTQCNSTAVGSTEMGQIKMQSI